MKSEKDKEQKANRKAQRVEGKRNGERAGKALRAKKEEMGWEIVLKDEEKRKKLI